MVERSLQFEQAISEGDRAALASFCQTQAQQGGPQDQEIWKFLRVNFEDDARRYPLTPPPPPPSQLHLMEARILYTSSSAWRHCWFVSDVCV